LEAEGRELPVVGGGHYRRGDCLRHLGGYLAVDQLRAGFLYELILCVEELRRVGGACRGDEYLARPGPGHMLADDLEGSRRTR